MNRASLPLVALALAARVAAQEVQGWRTPSGELYFGSAPPPGSTRIDSVRTRPTRQPAAPEVTAIPRFAVTAKPTATPRPTLAPAATAPAAAAAYPAPLPTQAGPPRKRPPLATPRSAQTPRAEASPGSPATWQRETACEDIVAIRDTRPTIDPDADRVVITGEILVTTRPVKDLHVCLGGICTSVAGGKALAAGETTRFRVSAARNRPTGLTVECSVVNPR